MTISVYTADGLKKSQVESFNIPTFKAITQSGDDVNVSTPVALSWNQDAEVNTDTSEFSHNSSTNNSRVTVNEAGTVSVSAVITAQDSGGTITNGQFEVWFRKNGSTNIIPRRASSVQDRNNNTLGSTAVISTPITVDERDYIEVMAMGIGSGVDSISMNLVNDQCSFSMIRTN